MSHPLSVSLFFHALILLLIAVISFWPKSRLQKIDLDVFTMPPTAQQTLNLNPPKPVERPKPVEARKVFGVHRDAITASESQENSATIKKGNTVAAAPDNLTLTDADAAALPIPADEYLVSSMPALTSEFRIPYPEEARKNNVEGPVVMDLLIDSEGRVRKVDLVQGPGHGLNEAAVQAVQRFQFRPAQMEGKPVAVKIRYTYRFVLEIR